MIVQELLGPLPQSAFVEQFFHKLPYSSQGNGQSLVPLGTKEIFRRLLGDPHADLLIARQGVLQPGSPPLERRATETLIADGCTLALRHVEKLDPALASLAADFRASFGGVVDVHLYWSPGGHFGFGWHYDAEDVFIVQLEGIKHYSLRKNTVNPWPTRQTLPANMEFEREIMPLVRCPLQAGDWLYIPGGYWHLAEAATECLSLAVGVLSPTRLDLLEYLRQRLAPSLRSRERLPVAGAASMVSDEQMAERLREVLMELCLDIKRISDEERTPAEILAWLRGV